MPDLTRRPAVNGIDLEAMDETVAAVARDPARGRIELAVKTEWTGQTRSETTVECCTVGGEPVERCFTITADEPRELFGSNTAPSPQELLMSAVNACLVICYVSQAAVRGIRLDSCRIETHGELDLRGFLGLDEAVLPGNRRITYRVFIEGDGTRDEFEKIHAAVQATSPNFFNMAQPIQMCGTLV